MDNKILIIIGIILLIVVGAILVMFVSSPEYEKIEITPNGTTIEVPINQTEYRGDYEGLKIWNWNDGVLVTYNNHEGNGVIKLAGLSFNTLNELVKTGDVQNVDGFKCYVIDAQDLGLNLSDILKVNYTGKFYCIPLSNATSQDNIIIFSTDQDRAVHMAKSVQYKNVYSGDIGLEAISTVENITDTNLTNVTDTYNNITDTYNNLTDAYNNLTN
jgi:hypothetical protein